MKAWRLHEQGKLMLDDMPVQTVDEGYVKLKTLASGISLTDVLMYEGKIPLPVPSSPVIIGHQCVGMITEVGEGVAALSRGDRVAIDPYVNCKNCTPCKENRNDECEKLFCYGIDDNGFMSDFVVVPASIAYKLPERVTDSDAVFTEHIALSINAVSKLNLENGEHIVIVGANALGIILAQVALYYQAIPILVDTDAAALAVAEELGVYYTVNSVEADPMKKIFSITGGRMADAAAFVATSHMSFGRSLDYVKVGGRVALTGWSKLSEDVTGSFSGILNKQLKVFGVNNGVRMFPSAINLLATRTINVSRLIGREVKFEEVDKAMSENAEGLDRFVKTVVKP